MIEIERKFRLSMDHYRNIEQYIKSKDGQLRTLHQIDEIYLLGIESFAEFKPGMPVMRLRTMDKKTLLTYKRVINDTGDTLEHELAIESSAAMRKILLDMDYRPVTIVDKIRTEIEDGQVTLMLDRVKDLGDFLEIEVMAQKEEQISEAILIIMDKAAEFDLTEDDIESQKYDKLMTEKAIN